MNEIKAILEEMGIYIVEEKCEDIDLRDYLTDSLQLITFIVEVEKKFNIELPEELLLENNIASLDAFDDLVKSLRSNSIKKEGKEKPNEEAN